MKGLKRFRGQTSFSHQKVDQVTLHGVDCIDFEYENVEVKTKDGWKVFTGDDEFSIEARKPVKFSLSTHPDGPVSMMFAKRTVVVLLDEYGNATDIYL